MSGCHDGHGASASQNDELSVLQRLTAVHHPGAEAIRESVSLPGQYLSDHDRARTTGPARTSRPPPTTRPRRRAPLSARSSEPSPAEPLFRGRKQGRAVGSTDGAGVGFRAAGRTADREGTFWFARWTIP